MDADFFKMCPLPWTVDDFDRHILDANGKIVIEALCNDIYELIGPLHDWVSEPDNSAHPVNNPVAALRKSTLDRPDYHDTQMKRLRADWPELYKVIMYLIG